MFRSLALSTTLLFAFAANASADVFFGTGTIQTGPATTATDVNIINGNTSLGGQFINGFNPGGAGTNTFASTTQFNAIGSNLLSTYGFQAGGGTPATYNGQAVALVFAATGNTPSPASISFTQGTVALYVVDSTTYNQFNPSTWGTGAAPIATFTLRSAENGVDQGAGQPGPGGGGPGIFGLSAASFNQAAVNATVGAANQGFVLLNEATNPNFWNQTGNLPLLPPNFLQTGEGIGIRFDDSLQTATTLNTQFISGGAGTAGFDLLNTIFNTLLPGVSPFGFAADFGGLGLSAGPSSNFNPSTATGAGSVPNTSDSVQTFGTTTGHFVAGVPQFEPPVPEPTTLAVFAGVMGLGGLVYRRRAAQ